MSAWRDFAIRRAGSSASCRIPKLTCAGRRTQNGPRNLDAQVPLVRVWRFSKTRSWRLTVPKGNEVKIRRALFTVSDKSGIVELAQALAATGCEIVATGRTATVLKDAGLTV